jgi:Protein of unknown function (DUF3298)
VLQIDNDTGGAHEGHPASASHAFNFDLAKQAPITCDALFKPGSGPQDVLSPIARREFDAPLLELLPSQCQNFALTDDEVIFLFGEGQVVPDNSGPHQISVRRSELAPLMARAGGDRLHTQVRTKKGGFGRTTRASR